MKASERREIMLKHRQRHIESLQKLGYIHDTMHAIKRLEHKANLWQTEDANGEVSEDIDEVRNEYINRQIMHLFGGVTPKGFFINGDPRGYTLKLDPEAWKVSDDPRENYDAQPIKYTDWGGYMILAPEEF